MAITVAERPVVTAGGGSAAYTEDAKPAAIAPALAIADTDSATIAGATVAITDRVAGDQLLFTAQNGITGSYDGATGVLTLTGTATRAAYEQALRSVAYATGNDNPADGTGNADRVVAFRVTDSGGLQSVAGVTRTVTVANANDAPTLTAGAVHALAGTDEATTSAAATVAAILAGTGFADADTGALGGMAVTGTTGNGT